MSALQRFFAWIRPISAGVEYQELTSTPDAPEPGFVRVYASTDNRMKYKDDLGSEYTVANTDELGSAGIIATDYGEVTLSSGTFAFSTGYNFYQIISESGPSDYLTNITGASAGDVAIISAVSGNTIVIQDYTVTGSFELPVGLSYFALSDRTPSMFVYTGTRWKLFDTRYFPSPNFNYDMTISSGSITPAYGSGRFIADTESSAAVDDLDTIDGTSFKPGDVAYIRPSDSARDIVLKYGTGNIYNDAGVDTYLNTTDKVVPLMYENSKWKIIDGSPDPLVLAAPSLTIQNDSSNHNMASFNIPANRLGTTGGLSLSCWLIAFNNTGSSKNITFYVKLGTTNLFTWTQALATSASNYNSFSLEVHGANLSSASAQNWILSSEVLLASGLSSTPVALTSHAGGINSSTEDTTTSLNFRVVTSLSAASTSLWVRHLETKCFINYSA